MTGFPMHERFASLDRRRFLTTSGMGLGATALAALLPANAAARRVAPRARARRVIFLFMGGAPSQVDLFDHKPDLAARFGEPLPPSVSKGQRVTAMTRGREQLVAPSMFGLPTGVIVPVAETSPMTVGLPFISMLPLAWQPLPP